MDSYQVQWCPDGFCCFQTVFWPLHFDFGCCLLHRLWIGVVTLRGEGGNWILLLLLPLGYYHCPFVWAVLWALWPHNFAFLMLFVTQLLDKSGNVTGGVTVIGYCCYHFHFVAITAPLSGLFCVHWEVTVALEFRIFGAVLRGILWQFSDIHQHSPCCEGVWILWELCSVIVSRTSRGHGACCHSSYFSLWWC
jgi:hypothetical protein